MGVLDLARRVVPGACLAAVLWAPLTAAREQQAPAAAREQQAPPAPVASAAAPAAPAAAVPAPAPASPAVTLTDADMERFLTKARIVKTKSAPKGVTNSVRATLSDGTMTHDAHIQTIDEYKREFRTAMTVEFDFRDSWQFNIAAYKLDRLIGLNMVPVSVQGRLRSDPAAITWWVDDVMMDEGGRLKQKAEVPEDKKRYWNQQTYMMRLFDQLIYNTDRNLGNMLIGTDWRLWAIDHTRAFRKHTTLKSSTYVSRCDREVFQRLKALDQDTLKRELGKHLDDGQIRGLLARRDAIVQRLESLGPSVLFESLIPAPVQ
jgi:hypothetical protein